MLIDQVNEIAILSHDNHAMCFGRRENVPIVGVPQVEVAHGNRVNPIGLRDPEGDPWRQLRIYPDRHATSTG